MKLLLDTCTIFYVTEQRRLRPEIISVINEAAHSGQLCVSLISAWEIGMLVSKGKVPITQHPADYFEYFLRESGAMLCKLEISTLINSSYLPGRIHGDPMDRLLVETARSQDLTLITSDQTILAYGKLGHVKTLAC